MKRIVLLPMLLFSIWQIALSQTCPPNLDFESGDFTNWECFTGTTSVSNGQNVINLTPSGPTAGRHEIISASSGAQLDPYGKFPKLCPYGGNYSVKLGNENTGSQAEGLSYTFTVPTNVDTFTFTYFYAVVFQDPNHLSYQQPRFFVTAYEVTTGNLINCASFDYISNGAIPGFEQSTTGSGVLFKKWSPASLQFAGLGGKSVRLQFKTADCTLGGHFGYAYLDVGSACSNIMATAPYCIETNSLILNAPYGFQAYTWYNENYTTVIGNQQSLTLTPPPATSGIFHVDVIPYPGYGCRDTLQAIVTPLPVPDTPAAKPEYTYCQFQTATALTATASPSHDLWWYTSATGGIGSTNAPRPSTALPGTFYYYVSQKVLFGCESIRKKITVKVIPIPATSFTINKVRQCQGENDYVFTSTSTNLDSSIFKWDFGDGQTLTSATDSMVHHNYTIAGNFTVKLKITNSGSCSSEKALPVTIIPKPIAAFTYPPVICEKQTAVTIVNTSFVPGGVATINQWWWNINGAIEQTNTPQVFTPATLGSLPVKLVVTTTDGCKSDTSSSVITVHYKPFASFRYSNPLCNNELIRFTDLSASSQIMTGEMVAKWSWKFENGNTSTMQHPSTIFTPGVQHAKLITETNFGCTSAEADSMFRIAVKPQIQLNINDSCVFRTISYQATDLQNTVDKWYWDFGSGLQKNGSLISRTYTTEGYRPFTILAETVNGCKDTVVRPFTIYDNKALAGRDTIVAWNEPVTLHAHGGPNVKYLWSPAVGLSNSSIENPVAILGKDQQYQLDAITDKGCDSHSRILIKRFKGPELYIPTAFTPDGDGLNDLLTVLPVGIKSFTSFSVYNRFGERLFYTTNVNEGWNGTYKGNKLDGGAYIAYAIAVDYRGNPLQNKITVMLIR